MVGAGCVLSVRVVRRLLGIRRYQVGGQNNRPPLRSRIGTVCDSQKPQLPKETRLIRFAGIRVRAGVGPGSVTGGSMVCSLDGHLLVNGSQHLWMNLGRVPFRALLYR